MATAAAVKERPIMFSDAMSRAIRDGRKTVTRRIINPQPKENEDGSFTQWRGRVGRSNVGMTRTLDRHGALLDESHFQVPVREWLIENSPWQVGMRLWIKESIVKIGHEHRGKNGQYLWPKLSDTFTEEIAKRWLDQSCHYTADMKPSDPAWDEPHGLLNKMFMPRWASRTDLEIVDVRAEHLHDITEADARAEGIRTDVIPKCGDHPDLLCFVSEPDDSHAYVTAREAFVKTWDNINGAGAWERNDWVWAIAFSPTTPKES